MNIIQSATRLEPGATEICRKAYRISWVIFGAIVLHEFATFMGYGALAGLEPVHSDMWLAILSLLLALTVVSNMITYLMVIFSRQITLLEKEIIAFPVSAVFFFEVLMFIYGYLTIPF